MITIEGYSGCGIRVFRNPDVTASDYILEKSAATASYVPRLLLQQQKQSMFSRFNNLPHVVVPNILYIRQNVVTQVNPDTGAAVAHPDGSKPLDCAIGMQFLHHVDAITFLAKASMRHVRGFSATLLSILNQYVAVSPLSPVPVDVFTDKLEDIQRIVRRNLNICEADRTFVCDSVIPALLESLRKETTIMLPLGMCHGDLTLTNILVAQQDNDEAEDYAITTDPFGMHISEMTKMQPACVAAVQGGEADALGGAVKPVKVVLIDFLDNFVESPLADMAKLCQDLKYAWSIRVSNSAARVDVVAFFSVLEFLLKEMEQQYAAYDWYKTYFRLMFVINQLRVLQYSKEGSVAAYLAGTVREEFRLWELDRMAPAA